MADSLSKKRKIGSEVRNTLKGQLYRRRGNLFAGEGWMTYCAYCNKPMKSNFDMHEVFITRGDASKSKLEPHEIYNRYNCVLVHHGECHIKAATLTGKIHCAKHLDKYENALNIAEWLKSLSGKLSDVTINEALYYNEGAYYDRQFPDVPNLRYQRRQP